MPRSKNDGRGRMGGRAKGTPNKSLSSLREWVEQIVNDNRAQVEKDLKSLEPSERIRFIEKLIGYVLPKPTAVGIGNISAGGGVVASRDPMAKPADLLLCGYEPWEDMSDRERARHLATYYKDIAEGIDKNQILIDDSDGDLYE